MNARHGAATAALTTTVCSCAGLAARQTEHNQHHVRKQAMDNKHLVISALDGLFVGKDASVIDRSFAEPYVQHNPQVPSGLEPLRGLVNALSKRPDFRYERVRALADGDLVVLHGRYTGWMPKPVVVFDLFRVKDGRIVEHWDAVAEEPPPNPSGRTMLDGVRESSQHHHTEANRAVVKGFIDTILIGGEFARMGEFFEGDTYLQHNPMVGDGVSSLGAFVHSLAEKGITMRYGKLHRMVAEGNLVLTQSEGTFGGKPYAFYDLFRVENGKIAEHWDVMQEVPPSTHGAAMF